MQGMLKGVRSAPAFAFFGQPFDLHANLRAEIPGNYLGRTFESVLNSAKALLHLRPGKNGKA